MEADFSTGAVGAPAFTPFRMRGIGKRLVLLACMAATPMAFAAESKPIPTQAAEAIEPFAKQYSTTVSRAVNDFMAGTSGPLGDAARKNQQKDAAVAAEANRGTRKTMAECLKPGDLIDQDVKECIEGKRVRDW